MQDYFLVDRIFEEGQISLLYVEIDRAIVGSAVPTEAPLELKGNKRTLAADYFCERRELGVINIGGNGSVTVDDQTFALEYLDGLYVTRGSKKVFSSNDAQNPAEFYLLSYPAHAEFGGSRQN